MESNEHIIKEYMRSIGTLGGKSKSSKKAAAARANGKLGGRPRKSKTMASQPNMRNG